MDLFGDRLGGGRNNDEDVKETLQFSQDVITFPTLLPPSSDVRWLCLFEL